MSSKLFTIREAKSSDAENGLFDVLSQLTDAPPLSVDTLSSLLSKRSASGIITLVAISNDNDHVIGTASIIFEQKLIRNASIAAHIEDVVVDNQIRGSGLGRKLVQNLVEMAQQRNCYKVVLHCSNENVPFYLRCGLQQKGIQMAIYTKQSS